MAAMNGKYFNPWQFVIAIRTDERYSEEFCSLDLVLGTLPTLLLSFPKFETPAEMLLTGPTLYGYHMLPLYSSSCHKHRKKLAPRPKQVSLGLLVDRGCLVWATQISTLLFTHDRVMRGSQMANSLLLLISHAHPWS